MTITFRDAAHFQPRLEDVLEYNRDVARSTGRPVGWVLAEEFGSLGGRYHCHQVMCGTEKLYRRFWWSEAFRRFGRSEISPFDPERGAAYYAAKYSAKQLGSLHFGGTVAGVDLERSEETKAYAGAGIVARSENMTRDFYRLGLGRWHR